MALESDEPAVTRRIEDLRSHSLRPNLIILRHTATCPHAHSRSYSQFQLTLSLTVQIHSSYQILDIPYFSEYMLDLICIL